MVAFRRIIHYVDIKASHRNILLGEPAAKRRECGLRRSGSLLKDREPRRSGS